MNIFPSSPPPPQLEEKLNGTFHYINSKSYKKTIKKYGSDHHPITVRVKNNTRKRKKV